MVTVVIVGAGLLGRGIATVAARAGHHVILHDSNSGALTAAHQQVRNAAQPSAAVDIEPQLERAVQQADVVIEAVLEDLSLKQALFHRIGSCNAEALLMSNSSVLPIGDIAARAPHPERAIGTHWWNPPHLIPVVEVIRGPHTSEEVMQRTCAFLIGLGKTAVRVERDVPGFVGNRLQHALWREALALVSEDTCSAADVDRIVSSTLGQSLAVRGPFEEMAKQGPRRVCAEFAAALEHINSDPAPASALIRKVEQGELGAKSGAGFFSWPPGARERAAQKLQSHIERRLQMTDTPPVAATARFSLEEEAIARRLHVALWREAISLIDSGVCEASTVDLMAKNTIGLRLAVMAPIENADYVGLDLTLAIHRAVLPSLNASRNAPDWLTRMAQASAGS